MLGAVCKTCYHFYIKAYKNKNKVSLTIRNYSHFYAFKELHPYKTFQKLKWCKAKKQLP